MTKLLFICHGNICRSPLAEFIFKDMVKKAGLEDRFLIRSAATSYEEYGNPVYPPVKSYLDKKGISCAGKTATVMNRADYDKYDYLICMDSRNLRNLENIIGFDSEGKVHLLMEYAGKSGDVSDPYYSRDFATCFKDIEEGCKGLFDTLCH